jgi:hypothetical protein
MRFRRSIRQRLRGALRHPIFQGYAPEKKSKKTLVIIHASPDPAARTYILPDDTYYKDEI